MTPERTTGWTVETAMDHVLTVLRAYDARYEQRFAGQEKAIELGLSEQKSSVAAALISAERAVQKAEMAAEKRFESVNEFRSTLADQQRNLMPRSEVAVIASGLTERVAALKEIVDRLQAERKGIVGGWGYAVGVAGLVALVTAFLMQFLTGRP